MIAGLKPEDISDVIHDQGVEFAPMLDDHAHRAILGLPLGHAQAAAHVDGGHDATTQIEGTGHLGRAEGNPVDRGLGDDVLNRQDRHTECLFPDLDRNKTLCGIGGDQRVFGPDGHAAFLASARAPETASSRVV